MTHATRTISAPTNTPTPSQLRKINGHAYVAIPVRVRKYGERMQKASDRLIPLLKLQAVGTLTPAQEARVEKLYEDIDGHLEAMADYLCLKN